MLNPNFPQQNKLFLESLQIFLTLSGGNIFTLKVESKLNLFYLTLLKHE